MMVIVFLISLLILELVGGLLVLKVVLEERERPAFGFGWLIGAFTSATCFVIFHQIFYSGV